MYRMCVRFGPYCIKERPYPVCPPSLRSTALSTVTDQEPVLKLQDVDVVLPGPSGDVSILRGLSLGVPAGQSLAVLGPSGSGKSTLLMVTAGLERVTRGCVVVAGQDITSLSEDALAQVRRDSIGIVFQSFHLIPTMTALENVAVPMELAGRRDAFERARAELAAVGLGERADHYPNQLSGGEQQRVALARALAPRPALLLADEPTGNLDGETGRRIVELLFERQRASGATLILVTHDPGLAARCDRIVHMSDGRLVEEPLVEESLAEEIVADWTTQ